MISPLADRSGETLSDDVELPAILVQCAPSRAGRSTSPLPMRVENVRRLRALRSGGTMMSMCWPTASAAGIAEQLLGGPVPGGDGAVERLGDDGIVGGFDDGAEQPLALAVMVAFRAACSRSAPTQADSAACRRDVVDQQHGEHEARGAEAVEPAGVEAEIEAGDVEDRRQRDVEQPGAQHDHEPDVDHRMRPAKPQHEQRREAEAPDDRHHADHGRGVVAVAQQDRQQVVLRR